MAASLGTRLRRWAAAYGPPGVLVGLPGLLILVGVPRGETLYGSDVVNQFLYQRGMIGERLAAGDFPVWDSTTACGFPLLAAMQSAVFYPFTWATAVLAVTDVWAFLAWSHLALAGGFAFGWLRCGLGVDRMSGLAGALVFSLSGFAVTRVYAGHVPQLCAYTWFPAVLWRTERLLTASSPRNLALLAGSAAMLLLAGHPQFAYLGLLAVAARLAHEAVAGAGSIRTRAAGIARVGAGLLAGVLLAAPQLLPGAELVLHAQRREATYASATSFSMPPEGLLTLVVPSALGDESQVLYWGRSVLWEACAFVGIGGLAMAAVGMGKRHSQRWLWVGVAVAAMVLALGCYTPFYTLAYHALPGAAWFRAPGRFLGLFALAAAALTALGLSRLQEPGAARVRWGAVVPGLVAAGAGVAWIVLSASGGADSAVWKGTLERAGRRPESRVPAAVADSARFRRASYAQTRAALIEGVVWGTSFALVLLAHALGRLSGRMSAGAVGALLAIELCTFGYRFFGGYPREGLTWPPEFVRLLREHPQRPVRIALPDVQDVGRAQLAGVDGVGSYESLNLLRFTELMNVTHGREKDAELVVALATRPSRVFDMLNVRFWVVPITRRVPRSLVPIGQMGDSYLYESPRAQPRAFVVREAMVLESPDERLRYLTTDSFDAGRVVVLETGEPSVVTGPGTDRVNVVRFRPGEYELEAEAQAGGYLVLTESFFPGWRAEIDGVPAEILQANHVVQAVKLPAGRHDVTFRYRSRRLPLGLSLATLGVLALAGCFLARRVRGFVRE